MPKSKRLEKIGAPNSAASSFFPASLIASAPWVLCIKLSLLSISVPETLKISFIALGKYIFFFSKLAKISFKLLPSSIEKSDSIFKGL